MGDSGDVSAATPSGSSSSTSLASSTRRSKSVVGATQVAGRRKRGTCVCPICNETIVDTTKNKKGHDAIFARVFVILGCTDAVLDSHSQLLQSYKILLSLLFVLIVS